MEAKVHREEDGCDDEDEKMLSKISNLVSMLFANSNIQMML